jgi:FtsH-binding integral membrane protein
VAAAGAWAHVVSGFGGGALAPIGMFAMLLWLGFQQDKDNSAKRLAIFACFAFFQGLSLGGLVDVILDVDPSVLITAFLGTVAIFICFSAAAMFARRRSYLYLGGLLSTCLSWMAMASLVSIFWPSSFNFLLQLYGGLLVFVGYVVLDTQQTIEKAAAGSTDFVGDALSLLIDFVAIFVRIAIILLRNRDKEDRRESSSDRRSRRR